MSIYIKGFEVSSMPSPNQKGMEVECFKEASFWVIINNTVI